MFLAMPLIYIVITLMVAGIILWLINTYVPMAGSIKTILNLVVVVAVGVWVLQALGLWQSVLNYRVPTVHGSQ
jgi:predicted membrane protein